MIVIAYIFYILAFSRINFSLYLQRSPQTAAVLKYFTCICTAVPEFCASDPAAVSKNFRVFPWNIFVTAAIIVLRPSHPR